MKQTQRGFTLIELVVVIVILGILAATALPRFVDLRGDAATAAVQGVAGGVTSAGSLNYSTCMVRGLSGADCTPINNATPCATLIAGRMTGDALPNGYAVNPEAATCAGQAAGTARTCTITGPQAVSAVATAICTG